MSLKIAHFSDCHLGYRAFSVEARPGVNARGLDVVKAFNATVDSIIKTDPPLVICSGDFFDSVLPEINYVKAGQLGLLKLCGIRSDGSRRQVVIISGNHDQPKNLQNVCILELFSGIPGLHIVTTGYETSEFTAPDAPHELKDIVVHSIPHNTLQGSLNIDEVNPIQGKVNILTTHGVAEGSDLFIRAQGREFAIPVEVMAKKWDYVALGHWHKQGPVSLTGSKPNTKSNVWYAGSTENISYRDVKGGTVTSTHRGWLLVELSEKGLVVTPQKVKVRPMIRLPEIDVQNMQLEDIPTHMKERLSKSNIIGAVVLQPIINASRETWNLVDIRSVQRAASDALHYATKVSFLDTKVDGESLKPKQTLEELLLERAKERVPEEDLDRVITLAKKYLGSELDKQIGEEQ